MPRLLTVGKVLIMAFGQVNVFPTKILSWCLLCTQPDALHFLQL